MVENTLHVKSHVARDLLQNAALFKTDKLVVWEYVSNGLQYVDPGTNPIVRVTLNNRQKWIKIVDNGRGMNWSGLKNFFVMHGENIDRQEGKAGRGRFGTGKSAAFGIADLLQISTVRHGKLSRIELSRHNIENVTSEEPVPVQALDKEVLTNKSNGTVVEVLGIHLRTLDQAGIIRYIERHLARWPKNVTVFVNNHECEFNEPSVAREVKFLPKGTFENELGKAPLIVKVSKTPLDEDLRGISIYSNGVWYETTLAGNEGREMAQYIFGEIDVVGLDKEGTSPIPAFDLSRSMRLNPSNPLVQSIYAFVGKNVEAVRRELMDEEKKRRKDEEAKKLAEQAEEIAQVINEDFNQFRQKIAKQKAKAQGSTDIHYTQKYGGDKENELFWGDQVPAEEISPEGSPGSSGGSRSGGGEPRNLNPQVQADLKGQKKGSPTGGTGSNHKPQGGFQVSFDHMGEDENRAKYFREKRTIYINLDHPQLTAAKGLGSTEELVFKRLAYEIALAEYAIALASELAAQGEYYDPTDAIFEVRETLNRVAVRAAKLYSSN